MVSRLRVAFNTSALYSYVKQYESCSFVEAKALSRITCGETVSASAVEGTSVAAFPLQAVSNTRNIRLDSDFSKFSPRTILGCGSVVCPWVRPSLPPDC